MSQAHRIEHLNEGQVLYIALDPDGVWARSEFPHPLVTVDYDDEDRVIGISPAGPRIDATLDAYKAWRGEGTGDTSKLVASLANLRDLSPA